MKIKEEKVSEKVKEVAEIKVAFTLKKINPAFISDNQKPKASIITCGSCHCSGTNMPS